MKKTLIQRKNGRRIYKIELSEAESLKSALQEMSKRNLLSHSDFSAQGSLNKVILAYGNVSSGDYKELTIREKVEILWLKGEIRLVNHDPKVEAHLMIGKSDGTVCGGTFVDGITARYVEVMLSELPEYMQQ